jgi:YaaC-like Protein
MRAPRPTTGWVGQSFPPPFDKVILRTSDTVRGELIGSIELYSEVKAFGKELLKTNGHTDLAQSFLVFQALMRQARTFFEAAEALHHRASPLNYYYSFMNLAKAFCFLRNPTFLSANLTHGLTPRSVEGRLRKQYVVAKANGVFPSFYRHLTGTHVPTNAKIRIADLLGYSSDVQYEYIQFKFGKPTSFFADLSLPSTPDPKTRFPS